MVQRNPSFLKLSEKYLFFEVMRRVKIFKNANPKANLISLSIGDTSEPLSETITRGLSKSAMELGTREGYRGYGQEQGDLQLRARISAVFYSNYIAADEIFISDGAKCDIGRLQTLFGPSVSVAVQDPSYPVYVDASLLMGVSSITFLPCFCENNFFPQLTELKDIDILYICSPNNPTGAVATKDQLNTLIQWAKKTHSLIIFDAAYSGYIRDPSLPRSIYEIPGADEVAIEVSSFSKLIGFTGVRAGWTVIPKKVCFDEGFSIHADFTRLVTTIFNGASIIAQAGALAALSEQGLKEMEGVLDFYLENAQLIKNVLQSKGCKVFGGENAPYLWVDFGKHKSWDLFQILLEKSGIISTPGSGFGLCGEGHLRLSAFGSRTHILNAVERIENKWPSNI